MTRVSFNYDECTYTLKLQGHAEFDNNGRDLVCAALSFFVTALAETLNRLEQKNKVMDISISLEAGNTEIVFRPRNQLVEMTLATFIQSGLELLYAEYPENIDISLCDFLANK